MTTGAADRTAIVAERISAVLGPRVMRLIAQVNKRVTNPIQPLWASRLRHMAVIEHRGRRSGTTYRTPVMVFVEGDELVVVLNYGVESDWIRNVAAAGTAGVLHRGRRYRLTNPRVIPVNSAELPAAVRSVRTPDRSVLHAALVLD
ncbi:nitroreductase family deazaflavin-dependent oxidoreductase [Mycolicibacterium sp. YH-1]|uniref:nitroreductase family deazaflavin-dependent oxidoreductase n=1 Tax=Mycolicibacterium sp. YH-1 TaxID=2908837 RepID=UPI001F4C03D2|nr:nitroreductase family deazaflavin-dependent oxidoreductase [Mycolicibacterium sp. YH-1]UNB50140.1 nitroreductase family deazaflavin-dependent oxidoreductase [Mycolicibacterium sp. YH-1]